jgi:hypothetical protein
MRNLINRVIGTLLGSAACIVTFIVWVAVLLAIYSDVEVWKHAFGTPDALFKPPVLFIPIGLLVAAFIGVVVDRSFLRARRS